MTSELGGPLQEGGTDELIDPGTGEGVAPTSRRGSRRTAAPRLGGYSAWC